MLAARIPAPFPHAGSIAWLRPEPGRDAPVQVRIVQHAADGQVRVSATGRVFPSEIATAFRRVDLAELAETEAEALRPSGPHRIRLSRAKGWRMPPNTASVARPTRWGNPYRVGDSFTPAEAVQAYRDFIELGLQSRVGLRDALGTLRGKNLACWCPLDQPCHADVLLALANRPAK